MAEDYYKTLEIGRTATAPEIQKAYRDLARKYHPDKNPDDETAKKKFQEVQSAFDTLNDPKKREMYDRYGSGYEAMGESPGGQAWPGGGGGGPNVNFEDLFGGGGGGGGGPGGFADLFKQFGGRGGRQRSASAPGSDIEHEITIPFATAILGGEAQISVQRPDGDHDTIQVKIPAGIEGGKKIRLRGQGDPGLGGGSAGDLLIKVRVAPHPCFKRFGKRLEVKVPITLAEAVAGGKIDVPTPHGTITLTVPPGTSSGRKLRAKGQGIQPAKGDPGDLLAELQIELPEDMSSEDQAAIAKMAENYQQMPRADLKW